MAEIDPQIVDLQSRIFVAGFKVSRVLKEANVTRHTWARIAKGESYRTATREKISQALDRLIAAKTPKQETKHGA
jgi:hypothetical protein